MTGQELHNMIKEGCKKRGVVCLDWEAYDRNFQEILDAVASKLRLISEKVNSESNG